METPGTILKREREARGIPLNEIASITRIPVSALRNLEDDQFDQFPAEVFVKGFLRNYARELNISSDDVILAYQALKQQQRRQDVAAIAEPRTPRAEPKKKKKDRNKTAKAKRARRASRDISPVPAETVTPLVLAASSDVEHESAAGAVESSQRTFRFAYLIVFLVVVTSLGLSVVFTGTGEAEENGKQRARPVLDDDADSSRWLMSDQKLTTSKSSSDSAAREIEDNTENAANAVGHAAGAADTADDTAPASPTESWSRPAFPQDDHE